MRLLALASGDEVMKNVNLATVLIIGFLCILVFVIVDCSAGKTRFFKCRVVSHHYDPPWTEVSSSTGTTGNTVIRTTLHNEEFHIICESLGNETRTIDVRTSESQYRKTLDQTVIWLRVRQGRISGACYMPIILDKTPDSEM